MTKRTIRIWLSVIVLTLCPAVACANAGTPLMWASAFHLLIGNAIIGIGEGLILALLFRQKLAFCIVVMLVANYFSTWIGAVFLIPLIWRAITPDLYSAWRWLWCMVAVAYGFTLLLEWPLVALCLRKCNGWFRKSVWASLLVQSASYLAIFGLYWAASGTSLLTDVDLVQPSAISLPKGAMLYYIDETNDGVYLRDFDRGDARKVCVLDPSDGWATLLLQRSVGNPEHWDLLVDSRTGDQNSSPRVVSSGLAGKAIDRKAADAIFYGPIPRFPNDTGGWEFDSYHWPNGLHGENKNTQRKLSISVETPFLIWQIRYPTQLLGGQVVFELGRNQICLIDPNQKKIAMLLKGRCPVVLLKNTQK